MKNQFIKFVRWVARSVRPVLLVIGAICGLANALVDDSHASESPAANVAAPAAAKIMSAPAATANEPAPARQSEPPASAGEEASANEPEAVQQESPHRELIYAGREASRLGANLLHGSGIHVFVGVIVHNLGWSFAWSFAFAALGLLIGAMLLRSAAQFFASRLEAGPAPAV
jgi:hypothetical protein